MGSCGGKMSGCGWSCGGKISCCDCGSRCKGGGGSNGGSGSSGCGKYIYETSTSETMIIGVAPVKIFNEGSEMGFGVENDCKCGSNCTSDNCGCGK